MAFLSPPERPNLVLRFGIWLAERITGRALLPARLLAWSSRIAVGSGILEALTPHAADPDERRLFKLIRMSASYAAACPFCVDMNGEDFEESGVSRLEIESIAKGLLPESLSQRESLCVRYARQITSTPLLVEDGLVQSMKRVMSEREIVVAAGIAAQVNYWARLIQALGIPPAGFAENCHLPPAGG